MLRSELSRSASVCAFSLLFAAPCALAQEVLPPIEIDGSHAAPGSSASAGPAIQDTTAGPVRGYQALTARPTRLDTPIKELPMSVQVIPRKLIDDQRAISQSEAFRNVSGLQPLDPLFPGLSSPSLRGMRAERYVDGLPNYYDLGVRDLLANVERIEVLKGPASILFQGGPNPIGGVINVVSKLPTPDRFAEVGVQAGGYRYASPYIDINQPLTADKSILFRVTAQYETTHSVVDVVNRRSYSIDPTIKIAPDDSTSLIVQGHLNRREQPDYPGLPAVGSIDRSFYALPRSAFLSTAGLPATATESSGVTARFEHKFNENLSTFTTARWSVSKIFEPSQVPFGNNPTIYVDPLFGVYGGPSKFYLADTIMSEQAHEVAISSNIVAKFDAGPTENRLLLGGDFDRVWDEGFMAGANATGPDPSKFSLFGFPQLTDFRAPAFPAYRYPLPGQAGYTALSRFDNAYETAGATAQLQSTIFERLHLLAALRLATIDIHSEEVAAKPPSSFDTNQTKFLPRVGLTFDVTNWLSVYGSYSEGLRAVTFFNGRGVAPQPEGSRQYEAGVKLDGPFGLSGALAYFDLERTNVPITPPGSLTQRQSGAWHSSGFEADLVWQPTGNLSFLASYAHIDACVSRDEDPRLVNARLNLSPRDSGRLWGNYAFDGLLQGWSLGAGLYAASGTVVEIGQPQPWAQLGRPWSTSGYVTFDSSLAYKHENFTFAITAKNIGDARYYVQYPYLQGRVAPGDGRTLFMSVSARM
ncbi:MAG: TonB-dependent siderophore receptor [Methylocystaceae bacterium]|nr:MAG: TonB-dependent siderophore receptor [Methylocystaceae bacterium]